MVSQCQPQSRCQSRCQCAVNLGATNLTANFAIFFFFFLTIPSQAKEPLGRYWRLCLGPWQNEIQITNYDCLNPSSFIKVIDWAPTAPKPHATTFNRHFPPEKDNKWASGFPNPPLLPQQPPSSYHTLKERNTNYWEKGDHLVLGLTYAPCIDTYTNTSPNLAPRDPRYWWLKLASAI